MSTTINGKTVYPTVGSSSRSGTRRTVRLMCAKSDAASVYEWFVNERYYSSIGSGTPIQTNGYFDLNASSLTYSEGFATLSLVFDSQNVQGLSIGSGATADRYDPVYSLSTMTEERPIEQHPDFKCSWAYNLYELVELDGTPSAVPAWAATDTNPAAIHPGYLWSRTPPSSPDPQHEYIQVQAATDFGMDSYLIPRPVVTSTIYYRTRQILSSDIQYVGQLKAPPETYIYPATASCWLVTSCDIQEASDTLLSVTTTYQFCAEGYKTKVYPVNA